MTTTTGTMRTIDFRIGNRPRDGKGRFLPTFTLTYDATLPGGEVVRFVRKLSAGGVEFLGRAITAIDFDDPRIDNIGVTDKTGDDVAFDFGCFQAGHRSTSAEDQAIALRLLTFIPPAAA